MVNFKPGDRVVLTDHARRTLDTAWKLFRHEPLIVRQIHHGYLEFENAWGGAEGVWGVSYFQLVEEQGPW